MQRELKFDTLETFLYGLQDLSIRRIAFCETAEKRSEEVKPSVLQVVDVNMVELIAYQDSVIYKCVLRDIDRVALYDRLVSLGFEVTRRSRNIT